MKEFKSILAAFNNVNFAARQAALATVVKVRGSSYRSPGARMLITDDGKWVGSISGGCLEGDALRKARQVMTSGEPKTVTYDTREESNQNLGIGLGCNGVIDVLIEPITAHKNSILFFKQLVEKNQPAALATVFQGLSGIGETLLINEDKSVISQVSNPALSDLIVEDLLNVFNTRVSHAKTFLVSGIEYEVFLELVQPSVSLVIFGGGFDARPVSQMAKALGWSVEVTDECVAHIAPVFFPQVDKLSLCHRDFIDRDFKITPFTACVLMSHNYEYYRDVLKKIIQTEAPYIGILGPRKRFDKMLEEFKRDRFELTDEQMLRIHSPIGLDIGAEAPDEIALAIVAEIQSKFSNRSGGFLKARNGPIHQRQQETDQVYKFVYRSENK
ncbi:MAG: XdhC family protein [Cyclobacteriaceae bacterium]|nr:XdhC family protein [Cyclobacteriaceae bacterium]